MGRVLAIGGLFVVVFLLFAPRAEAQCVGCLTQVNPGHNVVLEVSCDAAGDAKTCSVHINIGTDGSFSYTCSPIGICSGGDSECWGDYDDPPECWNEYV